MKISIISFTEQGHDLAEQIRETLTDQEVEVFYHPEQGLHLWTKEQFDKKRAVIFIGACGIAVRAIAPFIKDKMTDPPVIVLDEAGKFVIPILSGHLGGANELANLLAERSGAAPVITTATDLHDRLAVDLFAKKNGLHILNRDGIAKISAKVLRGESITFAIENYDKRMDQDEDTPPEYIKVVPYPNVQKADVLIASDADNIIWQEQAILRLKPREYVVGIGCRRGKAEDEIEKFVFESLQKLGLSDIDIVAVASIENKKEEPGICHFAESIGVPFVTFSGEQLRETEGEFSASIFVEKTVGVDNVCERAAMAACMGSGELVLSKRIENGMTVAVAKKPRKIKWEW